MIRTKTKTGQNLALILLIVTMCSSCQMTKPDLGHAVDYLPDAQLLQEGIVHKYYLHTLAKDAYSPTTIIEYWSFLLVNNTQLRVDLYDAAFQLTRSTQYQLEDDQMSILNKKVFHREDSIPTEVLQAVFYNWKTGESQFETKSYYPLGGIQTILSQRKIIADTLLEGKTLKRIERKQTISFKRDSMSQSVSKGHVIEYFAPGIGLFGYKGIYEEGTNQLELIEQIPLKKFMEMAKHDVKRIAYIDRREVMDKDQGFQLCDEQSKVVDYYNGQLDRAGYPGGKRALKAAIFAKIDQKKLYKESGFLTFRFIINCNGQAGWFVTELADYNYQKKEFHPETVQHLYEIISGLESWKACMVRGEKRDAYFYLTIKLEEGVITDLLP